MVTAYVSAGSNIDPLPNLRLAIAELRRRFGRLRLSPVYRTPAVGFAGDDFLNLVLAFETSEPPADVVAELERLHRLAGRQRGPDAFASRTLDLDLLLYGDEVIPQPPIKVPREDIRKYAFVLGPLADLAPGLVHPVTGETIGSLWAAFDRQGQPLTRVDVDLG
ncbi:MAG: 2-amino-4-hydroxy-6-hydroxymethyldihydropteridine diphosphokinase [Chromatiales bacterium]|nr:2-amino-4-hydroxy-6-hydroxymethyldihydropteridine diphosphokinase [Chromatiales bacterium]